MHVNRREKSRDAITLAQLRALVAVGRMGSFTKAGQVLGISQSAVSRTVASLEDELGSVLLNRTTRAVSLTKAGEVLVRHATGVLAEMDAAADAVQDADNSVSSTLSFVCAASIGSAYLAPTLSHFRIKCEDVQVSCLESSSQAYIENAVASGESDVGVLNVAELHPSLESRALWSERYHLCMRRDHPLAAHTAIQLSQVQDEVFITLPAQMGRYIVGDVAAARGRLHGPRLGVEQYRTALHLVEMGHGVLVLPASATLAVPDTLICPILGEQSLRRVVGAIWRRGTTLSRPAEEFIETLVYTRERTIRGSGVD